MGRAIVTCAPEMLSYARGYFGKHIIAEEDSGEKMKELGLPHWTAPVYLAIVEEGAPDGPAECIFHRHEDGTVTHEWRKHR